MNIEDKLRTYPTKRTKPVNGMAVTADVWEQSHDYHRLRHKLHSLFNHGAGIVTGLNVIASDPPDATVYVMPGIAIDQQGETIVLTEPLAFDLGIAEGNLMLLLTYEESEPRADSGEDQELNLSYIHSEFGLGAIPVSRAIEKKLIGIELARINRENRESPVYNPQDAEYPKTNELDLRYRIEIGSVQKESFGIGVFYLGGQPGKQHSAGLTRLSKVFNKKNHYQVCVDDNTNLTQIQQEYALLYLVGQDRFKLADAEMNALYTYIQEGGTVLFESNHQKQKGNNTAADTAFVELVGSMGIKLSELSVDHEIFDTPNLFAVPPEGFKTEKGAQILIHEGVIVSKYDYGTIWTGKSHGTPPSRETIRAAYEWGENIISYAIKRHLKREH